MWFRIFRRKLLGVALCPLLGCSLLMSQDAPPQQAAIGSQASPADVRELTAAVQQLRAQLQALSSDVSELQNFRSEAEELRRELLDAKKLIPEELSKIEAAASSGPVSKASIPVQPSGKPASAPRDEANTIDQVLRVYAEALQNKDPLQLRHVWPTLSDKQLKHTRESFRDAQSIRITVIPGASPNFNGNNATITCTQIAEITAQGHTQQLMNGATFYLKKLSGAEGDWVINRIDYQKRSR